MERVTVKITESWFRISGQVAIYLVYINVCRRGGLGVIADITTLLGIGAF